MPLQLKLTLNENILTLETNSAVLQEWMLTEYEGKLFERDIAIIKVSNEKRYWFNNLNTEKLLSSLKKYENYRIYTKK